MATFGGIRGLSQAFIRRGVKLGLSSTATINTLRKAGLTYRRKDMLGDFREWAQVPKKANVIKYVRRDYLPSKDMYVSTYGKQRAAFRYQVTGTIYNPETHERLPFTTNVVSEFQMTPNQVYDEALEPIKASTEAYKSDIENYVMEAAFYKVGEFWD